MPRIPRLFRMAAVAALSLCVPASASGTSGSPVALSTAEKLGLNGRSFAIGVTFAASVSLIAPFEPASLLVYGPGKYRFVDFVRVGGLLTLTMAILVIAIVPLLWPLAKPS